MSLNSNNVNLTIIGKPNSGKSTLFNSLLGKNISPAGTEYGLTKILFKEKLKYKNIELVIFDTPGLRRRSKVTEKNEIQRNSEVIKLINKVDVVILLIDSIENITRQDFRLADLSISNNKILFFLFNKIDLIDDKIKFKSNLKNFLKNNYSKYKLINIEFISAKKNQRTNNVLDKIIEKKKLISKKIHKKKLSDFIEFLLNKGNFPKINKIEVKPKYIVQIDSKLPRFKVFINTKKRAPHNFVKYFDNAFRSYFKLEGVPIIYDYISSKNPYSNQI